MSASKEKTVTWLELMQHNKKSDLWILINGFVYDVTTYLAEHPGGDDILIKYAGRDCTTAFNQGGYNNAGHTDYAKSIRDQKLVGSIEKSQPPQQYVDWIKLIENNNNEFTWKDISQHNKDNDLWVAIEGNVYDLTKFINEHPGGPVILKQVGGRDATSQFQDVHKNNQDVQKKKEQFRIGKVKPGSQRVEEVQSSTMPSYLKIFLLALGIGVGYFLNKFYIQK